MRLTALAGHQENVVDRNENQFDKKPYETHDCEPEGAGSGDLLVFCLGGTFGVWLRALGQQSPAVFVEVLGSF